MSSCDGASFRILDGIVDFRRLPMSIWAGLSRFAHTGVVPSAEGQVGSLLRIVCIS